MWMVKIHTKAVEVVEQVAVEQVRQTADKIIVVVLEAIK
jgi:hypothetical protein